MNQFSRRQAQDIGGGFRNRGIDKKLWAKNRAALRAAQSAGLPAPGQDWKGFGGSLPDCILEECAASGIPADLAAANIRYAEGLEARELLGVSRWSKNDKAKACDSGIWYTFGSTIDGGEGISIYAKPLEPRRYIGEGGKLKTIKYETRVGDPAVPLLPNIPDSYCELIEQRYGVTRNPDETPWQFIRRCKIQTVLTEGFKKALALIAQGIPAIALRGVACWHPAGTKELWPELSQFTDGGQRLLIAFDQDSKPETLRAVSAQISQLGRALKSAGAFVSVLVWGQSEGKGIDDAIATQGEQAEGWLNKVIATAPSFDDWSKGNRKAHLLRGWRYLEETGIELERLTVGEHIPPLPELEQGAIHVLTAPMGCGKTTQLKAWVQSGYLALCLSPLNSLGQQSANSWGLPHRHDCGNDRDQQTAFRLLVQDANGVVCCIDSLARIREFITEDTPLLIVLDEADQVLESLNLGGTLKSRQSEILELFANNLKIAARTGAIVLSEATVSRRSIEQIKALSGSNKVRYFRHEAERQPWPCELAGGGSVDKFAYELIAALGRGQKIILTVSSQNQGEKLDRLTKQFFPDKKVLRLDGKTNEGGAFDKFWQDPDSYLGGLSENYSLGETSPGRFSLSELPDLLILSPSAKSGISITIPGFDSVWGLFTCHYPAVWAQQLGRYRLPVPRRISCPTFIPASTADEGYCSTWQVKRRLEADAAGYARVFDLADELDRIDIEPAELERLLAIEASQREFYSAHQTSIGIQKQFPRDCLAEILTNQGHIVSDWQPSGSFAGNPLKRIQEEIWLEDADLFAAQQPDFDSKEARKRLSSLDLTRSGRAAALKVLYREEFPGVSFDDLQDCYLALTENFGRLRRGVLLQAQAANLEAYRPEAAEQVKQVLSGRLKLTHNLPQNFFNALLIREVGLLSLLDGSPYTEADERVKAIKAQALHFKNEIYKYFTLTIKPDQTGIEITNKLLRKLHLKAKCIKTEGKRGEQVRIWGLLTLCDSIRVRLLQAAFRKIGGDDTSVITDYPSSYHSTFRSGLECARSGLESGRAKSNSWKSKTSGWAAAAADKVDRLQAKLDKAVESGCEPEWLDKLATWLYAAKDKLARLQEKHRRADIRVSLFDSEISFVSGEIEQYGQAG